MPDDPITATIHSDYSQFTYKDLLLRGRERHPRPRNGTVHTLKVRLPESFRMCVRGRRCLPHGLSDETCVDATQQPVKYSQSSGPEDSGLK